jgi:hypothetical protein
MSNSSHSSLDLMLEEETSRDLDVSDHCVSIATTDSLQAKQKQNSDEGKARRSSKRMSKRGAPSLDAFVEDCNNSFGAMDLLADMSDLMTVDSRVPNMTGSKTRLTSDRPTRRPAKVSVSPAGSPTRRRRAVQRTHSEEMKAAFPVKFERAF